MRSRESCGSSAEYIFESLHTTVVIAQYPSMHRELSSPNCEKLILHIFISRTSQQAYYLTRGKTDGRTRNKNGEYEIHPRLCELNRLGLTGILKALLHSAHVCE
jgi:hypothetical protein